MEERRSATGRVLVGVWVDKMFYAMQWGRTDEAGGAASYYDIVVGIISFGALWGGSSYHSSKDKLNKELDLHLDDISQMNGAVSLLGHLTLYLPSTAYLRVKARTRTETHLATYRISCPILTLCFGHYPRA